MKTHLSFIIVFFCLASSAQKISGTLIDSLNVKIPYATVALLNKADTSIVKGSLSDENGAFEILSPGKGDYLLRIQSAGFATLWRSATIKDSLSDLALGSVQLRPDGINLNEVSVTVMKPTIEFKQGNIVMNVENSPLATGNTVLDLLMRMPGVTLQNNELAVNGSPGVKVYIDERVQPLAGLQLLSLLRSMSASGVSAVELIKNPPARYDAEGAAGIINIKTKKIKITGWSGNAGYRISQGWAAQNDLDFGLNYKGKKINVFSSLNLVYMKYRYTFTSTKTIPDDIGKTKLVSESAEFHEGGAATFNLALDWFVNKKTVLGLKTQVLPGKITRTRSGNTLLSDNSIGYDNQVFRKETPNEYVYLNSNFNAEHRFDTLGTKLRFSLDLYAPYYDTYKSKYEYYYYDAKGDGAKAPDYLNGYNKISLNIVSGRFDFEKKLSKSITLETGVKDNFQLIPSDYFLEKRDPVSGKYLTDSLVTNSFSYKENIAAAYLSLRAEWKKFTVQAGLRGENTDILTYSKQSNYEFERHYLRFFPTVSVDRNFGKDHSLSVSYNKRIWRPHYENLNPYYQFNTLYSISVGNPYLQPQYTDHFSFTHGYKSAFYTTFNYFYQINPMRGQTLQVDSLYLTIYTTGNLRRSNEANLFFNYAKDLKKWWNLNATVGLYFYDFDGTVQGQKLNTAAYSYHFSMNQVFSFAKHYKLEASGYYVAPWLYGGFYLIKPRGALDLGITRSLLNDKLKISFTAADIFYSSKLHYTIDFYDQQIENIEKYDSRRFNFSIRYDFGKMKVEERRVNNDEVKERMGK